MNSPKKRWSVSDGNSFEFYVELDSSKKNVNIGTFNCGVTEVLAQVTYQDFKNHSAHAEIKKYLGKDSLAEIQDVISSKADAVS